MSTDKMLSCCEYCDDGEGNCAYPHYGVAPHSHYTSKTGLVTNGTVIFDEKSWPDNFTEDPDCAGCGTYTHCPKCGRR